MCGRTRDAAVGDLTLTVASVRMAKRAPANSPALHQRAPAQAGCDAVFAGLVCR